MVLGGPLEGTDDVLLIFRADHAGRNCISALGRSVAPQRPSSRKSSYAVGTATRLAVLRRRQGFQTREAHMDANLD